MQSYPQDINGPQTLKTHHLMIGDLACEPGPCVMTTLLGSCVSVCLWEPSRSTGSMSHFVYPRLHGRAEPSNRYGDVVVVNQVRLMGKLGIAAGQLRAMVYGGASVLCNLNGFSQSTGDQNVEVAMEVLKAQGIRVMEKATGGMQGRRITFDTSTGRVEVRELGRSPNHNCPQYDPRTESCAACRAGRP